MVGIVLTTQTILSLVCVRWKTHFTIVMISHQCGMKMMITQIMIKIFGQKNLSEFFCTKCLLTKPAVCGIIKVGWPGRGGTSRPEIPIGIPICKISHTSSTLPYGPKKSRKLTFYKKYVIMIKKDFFKPA